MKELIRIAIAGSSGRMGKTLIEATLNADDMQLVGALDRPCGNLIGKNAGSLVGLQSSITITDKLDVAIANAHCLIDFTRPEGTLHHLISCRKQGVPIVIGSTGFETEQKLTIQDVARDIPIVYAPNMSVGVNLVFKLLDTAARILNTAYDVEIIEAHHRNKVDSPSGTALRMGEVIAHALGRNLSDCATYGREGIIGERDEQTIGFSTIRGGDIVGDHTVLFAGTGERIEISHKAGSRMPYALGALHAVRFLQGKRNGLYDMQDVLGLR